MLDQPLPCDVRSPPADLQAGRSARTGLRGGSTAALPLKRATRDLGLAGVVVVSLLGLLLLRVPPEKAPATTPVRTVTPYDVYPETGTEMAAADTYVPSTSSLLPMDGGEAAEAVPEPSADELPDLVEATLRLDKGDSIARLLRKVGLAATDIAAVVAALSDHVGLRSLPIGQLLGVTLGRPASPGDGPVLHALTIRPDPRREIKVRRNPDGDYSVEQETFKVVRLLKHAAGEVDGSVIASAEAAGVPQGALAELLRAFSWDVNFQHDIKAGDRFAVLVDRGWTEEGEPADGGRLLWAELTTGGGDRLFRVYRFKPRDGEEFFYNEHGESVVKALLRTPLNMSRISSRFGMRRHPVLGFTRMHAGIDFVAPAGTPILAAGSGRVLEAGYNGGYGKWVKIGHGNGMATGYAHMSRIAPGVRRSARVRQGQVIGYVGSTGLSTGPHLHFELHRHGKPVNPQGMARTPRARLAGSELRRFKAAASEIDRRRVAAMEDR
jgi:murein DD-endopeptidase MepM/ murein hydrolase activator NlpD